MGNSALYTDLLFLAALCHCLISISNGTDKLKIIDELMCNMKYIVTWRTPLTIFFTVKTSNYIHGETRTTYLVNFCCSFSMRKFIQGFIFHSGFLGEVQFKFELKKWTFEQTSEVVFTIQGKPPKSGL